MLRRIPTSSQRRRAPERTSSCGFTRPSHRSTLRPRSGFPRRPGSPSRSSCTPSTRRRACRGICPPAEPAEWARAIFSTVDNVHGYFLGAVDPGTGVHRRGQLVYRLYLDTDRRAIPVPRQVVTCPHYLLSLQSPAELRSPFPQLPDPARMRDLISGVVVHTTKKTTSRLRHSAVSPRGLPGFRPRSRNTSRPRPRTGSLAHERRRCHRPPSQRSSVCAADRDMPLPQPWRVVAEVVCLARACLRHAEGRLDIPAAEALLRLRAAACADHRSVTDLSPASCAGWPRSVRSVRAARRTHPLACTPVLASLRCGPELWRDPQQQHCARSLSLPCQIGCRDPSVG